MAHFILEITPYKASGQDIFVATGKGDETGVPGAVERKIRLRKRFGGSGYDGGGQLTGIQRPVSVVRAHHAQVGRPPRYRRVAQMSATSIHYSESCNQESRKRIYLAILCLAIHYG
jgi:hypothetical protein